MQTIFYLCVFCILSDGIYVDIIQVKLDAWILLQEASNPARDHFHCEKRTGANPEDFGLVVLSDQRRNCADFIKCASTNLQQQRAFCGNGYTARAANKQLTTQRLFQEF